MSEHIAALKREIKRVREALHIGITAKCKAEDAARRVTWVWEKALIESLPSGMRELVMEAVFKNAERAQMNKTDLDIHERIADLERQMAEAREVIKPLADLIKNIPETYGDNYLTELISCRAIRRAAQWTRVDQEQKGV